MLHRVRKPTSNKRTEESLLGLTDLTAPSKAVAAMGDTATPPALIAGGWVTAAVEVLGARKAGREFEKATPTAEELAAP